MDHTSVFLNHLRKRLIHALCYTPSQPLKQGLDVWSYRAETQMCWCSWSYRADTDVLVLLVISCRDTDVLVLLVMSCRDTDVLVLLVISCRDTDVLVLLVISSRDTYVLVFLVMSCRDTDVLVLLVMSCRHRCVGALGHVVQRHRCVGALGHVVQRHRCVGALGHIVQRHRCVGALGHIVQRHRCVGALGHVVQRHRCVGALGSLCTSAQHRRFVAIHNIQLPEPLRRNIPACCVLTGCDIVSQLRGNGKTSIWKIFHKHGALLASLGHDALSEVTMEQVEEFICRIYLPNINDKSINEVRYKLFQKEPATDSLHPQLRVDDPLPNYYSDIMYCKFKNCNCMMHV